MATCIKVGYAGDGMSTSIRLRDAHGMYDLCFNLLLDLRAQYGDLRAVSADYRAQLD